MTSMAVQTFLRVAPKLPPSISILLRGNHGIGKSQLARQLARLVARLLEMSSFPVIDRRLSQVSEGDIIGLPSTEGSVTRFNPPDWYKRACNEPVLLFLDELNRATPEVMQAAFQIILDRELNGHKLHPQTRVMSAVNVSAAYNVNEIDPALLDRFYVVDLTPDLKDWVTWGRQPCDDTDPSVKAIKQLFGGLNCAPLIVDFIAENERFLDPPKNFNPGDVQVSRRSWERLGDALAFAGVIDHPTDDSFYPICTGFIGVDATIKFCDYAKSVDNRFTGEDVVERYQKVRPKIQGRQNMYNAAIDKAATYVQTLTKVNERQGKNIDAFMNDLPGELRVSLWTKLTSKGIDQLELAKSLHVYLASHVLDVFGVPMGEAGIGVIPNIPGIFRNVGDKAPPKK